MSKTEIRFNEPAKKVVGLSEEKRSECGAVYSSVVGEIRGYDARTEGEKGEMRRIGRARKEVAYRLEAGS